MATLGPAQYPRLTDKGLKDNSISSIRLVSPGGQSGRGTPPALNDVRQR
jgi:hypothetical protein